LGATYSCLAKTGSTIAKNFNRKENLGGAKAFWLSPTWLLVCLHNQTKSGFFGGPAFIQPIRAI